MEKRIICVYAVCKNEEQFVDRFMDPLSEADMVIIGDTGSTDNTVQRFLARGAIVHDIPVHPWRFDEARNKLLKHIPKTVDICVALDVDEVISTGWRAALEAAWTPETTKGSYQYTWSFNPDGTPGVQFLQHRFHTRHNYRWIYPTHEVLDYIGKGHEVTTFLPGLTVEHFPDLTKNRGFNLELLELAMKEFPQDCRNLHYLGREYMFAQRWQDGINTLQKYLAHPKATWADERSATMRFIARCYAGLKQYTQVKAWLLRAIAETPGIREPYTELAFQAYVQSDWPTVYYAVTEALNIHTKNVLGYANDPRGWNSFIYDLGALGCYHIGLLDQAVKYAEQAVALSPEDERLKNNLDLIRHKAQAKEAMDNTTGSIASRKEQS